VHQACLKEVARIISKRISRASRHLAIANVTPPLLTGTTSSDHDRENGGLVNTEIIVYRDVQTLDTS
jgi:hypothetical protein